MGLSKIQLPIVAIRILFLKLNRPSIPDLFSRLSLHVSGQLALVTLLVRLVEILLHLERSAELLSTPTRAGLGDPRSASARKGLNYDTFNGLNAWPN